MQSHSDNVKHYSHSSDTPITYSNIPPNSIMVLKGKGDVTLNGPIGSNTLLSISGKGKLFLNCHVPETIEFSVSPDAGQIIFSQEPSEKIVLKITADGFINFSCSLPNKKQKTFHDPNNNNAINYDPFASSANTNNQHTTNKSSIVKDGDLLKVTHKGIITYYLGEEGHWNGNELIIDGIKATRLDDRINYITDAQTGKKTIKYGNGFIEIKDKGNKLKYKGTEVTYLGNDLHIDGIKVLHDDLRLEAINEIPIASPANTTTATYTSSQSSSHSQATTYDPIAPLITNNNTTQTTSQTYVLSQLAKTQTKPQATDENVLDKYSEITEEYIATLTKKEKTNTQLFQELNLTVEEKMPFIRLYDPITGQLPDIAVSLNYNHYNLQTLLDALAKNGLDPIYNRKFTKRDIQIANKVESEIVERLKLLSENKNNKNNETAKKLSDEETLEPKFHKRKRV